MPDLKVQCSQSSSRLRLSQFEKTGSGAYDETRFLAELTADGISAQCEVPGIVSTAWIDFFDDLAQEGKGWSDTRGVKSVEGHLAFTATCDALGHVEFVVELRESPLYKGWCVELPLHLELGQLEALAKRARGFF